MNRFYSEVALRAAYRCEYCHAPSAAFNLPFEIDHITPRVSRGDNTPNNLALACRSCNGFKSIYVAGLDPLTREAAAFYDPRRDSWDDHFQVDMATLEIIGKTATGLATIFTLRMNSAAQLLARRQWKRIELFP